MRRARTGYSGTRYWGTPVSAPGSSRVYYFCAPHRWSTLDLPALWQACPTHFAPARRPLPPLLTVLENRGHPTLVEFTTVQFNWESSAVGAFRSQSTAVAAPHLLQPTPLHWAAQASLLATNCVVIGRVLYWLATHPLWFRLVVRLSRILRSNLRSYRPLPQCRFLSSGGFTGHNKFTVSLK